MLEVHGLLLATFTYKRRHRLVTRHCREGKNGTSWDCHAIEEITCHQIWQLQQPFMAASNMARPRGKMLIPLREVYPGVADDEFSCLSGIKCNGGSCSPGDVVSFLFEGRIQLGQLLMSVGVHGQVE